MQCRSILGKLGVWEFKNGIDYWINNQILPLAAASKKETQAESETEATEMNIDKAIKECFRFLTI